MTNFDFLKIEEKFENFADVAISAEKILPIDVSASIINCRRAMEFAVKWMYSVDSSLVMPWAVSWKSLQIPVSGWVSGARLSESMRMH